MKRIKENSREKEPFVILSHSFSTYYSYNYFPDDKKKTCRRKKVHIIREEGFEVYVNLVIISTSVEWAERCCQPAGAALPSLNKRGHSWQMAEAAEDLGSEAAEHCLLPCADSQPSGRAGDVQNSVRI